MSTPITFIVPGQRQTAASRGAGSGATPAPAVPGLGGVVKDSVRVGARRSGGGDTLRLTATPGEDVVVLHISNGPALVLHPETARDLMLAQAGVTRTAGSTRGANGALTDPNEVTVSATLGWKGLETVTAVRGVPRGLLGQVLLQAIDVVGGLIKNPAADFIAAKVVDKVDSQVDAGVYELRPDGLQPLKGSTLKRDKLPAAPDGGPILMFVHGTFVDTASTFGKLWALHPQRVRELFAHYGDRVYALDHPTMGASPIANALTLAKALPQDAKLHLVTHSRGGVVAEVLARVCGKPRLDAEDFKPFQGEGYAQQRADLQALADIVAARRITVERMVRVACPARGTLLASRRFDAYLSVLKWTLDLAGVPVAPALLDFLGEVAGRRADPTKIPGVAAMMPDSPLVQWLNSADDAVPGQLRVVAGDLEGDSVGSWLKTLLADAFYWTDNDLVVQTRSMYGGTPRERGGASFLLDQGGKVTHFNYFANERTVQAVVTGLTQDAPQGFRTIGPLSWAGEDASGVRGREERGLFGSDKKPADTRPPAEKPAVFVLPGILGSNLKVGDKRVWLSLRIIGGLERLAYAPGVDDDVEPDGPIGMIYGDLIEYLSRTHEVIPFAYDWRCPVEEEAQRLGRAVDAALNARNATGQPVRILAHSMGGVLARTMALECAAVWQRLMAREGARFVMLGTPNGGSWAPMQCLSGDESFGNTLAAFGKPFQDHEARQIMASFPGFLQLQGGLTDARLRLDTAATWADLAKRDLATVTEHNWWHRNWLGEGASDIQQNPYTWGVPPQPVLDAAVKLRRRLDEQREGSLKAWANKALLVVGASKFTPQGYEWTDEGLVYLNATDGGDGRVTLDSALLPGVRTWRLGCSHGDLPDEEDAFPAFLELLERGDTARLQLLERALPTRGAAAEAAGAAGALVRSRPSRGRPLQPVPAVTFRSVFQAPADGDIDAAPAPASAALRLSVLNGNLMFVQQPLMLGHYRSLALTGTEWVVDRLLGGAMSEALRAGLYPDQSGVPQVFVNHTVDAENPWRLPRPPCAIVIGLGEEGKLDGIELSAAVRQGVIAWAQRVVESPNGAPASFELAATLIGSGGAGVSPGTSARAIAAGVRLANERLAATGWPQVSRLTLVELYLDRAADAWHGLQVLATSAPGLYEVDACVTSGTGPLRRAIDSDYRGADYDLVSATTQRNAVGDATIGYTLDTRRARTEVRAQSTQGKLLRELVATASNNANRDEQIGRTLFQLLVPIEMEPFLGGTSRMVLELDGGTAGIPWEMLDTPEERRAGSDRRPWAIRSQLLRKLRTADFRERVVDAIADDDVLVIGEPACDLTKYPALPGARAEAQAVAQLFAGPGGVGPERLNALVEGGADARTIINALLARRYRIVHIAGHGEAGEPGQDGRPTRYGGVVLSGDTFLGPHEIQTMRVVPELVFVNCCHLAGRDASQVLAPDYDRASFAANVAESLIKIGVRCVVAAGWAVDDLPAKTFATRLYAELLAGKRFVDAVALAREAAWAGGAEGNTWAAYQCYGDPDWQFRPQVGDAQPFGPSLVNEYDGIASPMGLALALEQLAVASKFQGARPDAQCERIRHLEARFAAHWGGMGAVAEAYAVAYSEAGAPDEAIRWYRMALQANDGSASLRASEQLGNLRARTAYARAKAAQKVRDGARREAAIGEARDEIVDAREALRTLARLQPTIERASLCASASKRLAMLETLAARPEAAAQALRDLATHYREAEDLARDSGHPDLFYPALNRMAAELVVRAGEPRPWAFDAAQVQAVRASLLNKATHDPDFWCMVGQIDLELYEALAAHRVAQQQEALVVRYDDLHQRVAAPRLWGSVADQAEFVLEAVMPHRRGAELQAAQALMVKLKGYAGRG